MYIKKKEYSIVYFGPCTQTLLALALSWRIYLSRLENRTVHLCLFHELSQVTKERLLRIQLAYARRLLLLAFQYFSGKTRFLNLTLILDTSKSYKIQSYYKKKTNHIKLGIKSFNKKKADMSNDFGMNNKNKKTDIFMFFTGFGDKLGISLRHVY